MRNSEYRFDDALRNALLVFLRRMARGTQAGRAAVGAGFAALTAVLSRAWPEPVGRVVGTVLSLVFAGMFRAKRPDIPPVEPVDPFTLTSAEPEFPFGRFIGGRGIAGVGGTLARELETLEKRGY